MKKRHRKLLSDLKKIAAHFKLKLSKMDIINATAFAIDNSKKKLLFINESDLPFFKTIDLWNIHSCAVRFDYTDMRTGDLKIRPTDDSIAKVQLEISHVDPAKSLDIEFYNSAENNVSELRQMIDTATNWRDTISAKLRRRLPVRA